MNVRVTSSDDSNGVAERCLAVYRLHVCGQRWFETEGRGHVPCFQQLFDRRDVKKKDEMKQQKERDSVARILSVEIFCCRWGP